MSQPSPSSLSTPPKPEQGAPAAPGLDKQLLALRDMTRRTGFMYDQQKLNLRMWPQVLFSIREASVVWDVEDRTVTYDLLLKDKLSTGEDLEHRLAALDQWVHELLGDEWRVIISTRARKGAKTRLLHRGERLRAIQDMAKPPPAMEGAVFQEPLTQFRRYHLNPKAVDAKALAPPPPLPIKETP